MLKYTDIWGIAYYIGDNISSRHGQLHISCEDPVLLDLLRCASRHHSGIHKGGYPWGSFIIWPKLDPKWAKLRGLNVCDAPRIDVTLEDIVNNPDILEQFKG